LIRYISKKYSKIVHQNLYNKLKIGTQIVKIEDESGFIRLSTRFNLEHCYLIIQVQFSFLQRYIRMFTEMPLNTPHVLQVTGDDPDGNLTQLALEIGLRNIPRLESISLNMEENDLLFGTFAMQIIRDTSLRRLKIIFPITNRLSLNKMMSALAKNEHIEELSLIFSRARQ